MDVISEAGPVFGEVALSLDIGYWVIDLATLRVYWPRGLGLADVDTSYSWTSLQAVSGFYPDGERQRFRSFIEEIVCAPGETRILNAKASGPNRSQIALRMAGRLVRNEEGARIYGVLEVVAPGQAPVVTAAKAANTELAHSLTRVLDSFFMAAQTAAVVFGRDLRIWRASPMGLRALGLAGEHADHMSPERIEAALPADVLKGLVEAIRQCAGSSGTHTVAGRALYHWRVQAWSQGEEGAGGAVLVMTPVVAGEPAARANHMTGQKFLEALRAPLLVVSSTTAEVDFANSSARHLFNMKAGDRYFVRNLVEVCGHAVPAEAYEEVRRGASFVSLKSGARIMKADEGGTEILIEYLH